MYVVRFDSIPDYNHSQIPPKYTVRLSFQSLAPNQKLDQSDAPNSTNALHDREYPTHYVLGGVEKISVANSAAPDGGGAAAMRLIPNRVQVCNTEVNFQNLLRNDRDSTCQPSSASSV